MTYHPKEDLPDPVDESEVDDKFKPGTGKEPCPSCGSECSIQHDITEYGEFIYCDECRVKFTREREPCFEDDFKSDARTIIETPKEQKEGYVRFKCYRCSTKVIENDYRIHEKTTVDDNEFTRVGTGLVGYDECKLACPCGERHQGYLDIGEKIECNCGRVFELSMD